MINARDKCPQCKKPIFLRGISEDRPIFAEMPVSLAVKIAQVIADDTAIAVVKEGIANG